MEPRGHSNLSPIMVALFWVTLLLFSAWPSKIIESGEPGIEPSPGEPEQTELSMIDSTDIPLWIDYVLRVQAQNISGEGVAFSLPVPMNRDRTIDSAYLTMVAADEALSLARTESGELTLLVQIDAEGDHTFSQRMNRSSVLNLTWSYGDSSRGAGDFVDTTIDVRGSSDLLKVQYGIEGLELGDSACIWASWLRSELNLEEGENEVTLFAHPDPDGWVICHSGEESEA